MNPPPDFVMTAKACGASGVMVRAAEDLSEVLKRGLQTRSEKRSFVVDAIVDQV
jgi:thiamine pyrophosphate-dependent acetolactate synthase large subunit-like protein